MNFDIKEKIMKDDLSEYEVSLADGLDLSTNPIMPILKERYSAYRYTAAKQLVWNDDLLTSDEAKNFRGDNAYVWQLRGSTTGAIGFIVAYYYLKSMDSMNILSKVEEDGFFGAVTHHVDNRLVSRDLIDSLLEIYFLERQLNVSKWENLKILDIGAGYGRLAHRAVMALDNLGMYLCTDAFPASSLISEYYLKFRGLDENKARVIYLHQIEEELGLHTIDIAVNIHSFSECTLEAVAWWIELLRRNAVRYLMVVPNSTVHDGGDLGKSLYNHTKNLDNFGEVIANAGYRRIAMEPKYSDPKVQMIAPYPTHYHLFELEQ